MIVYVGEPPSDGYGLLCTMSHCTWRYVPHAGRILVDVGFKNLFNGVGDKYLEFVRRVVERASGEVLAVSPDVPGDARATRESFERWAPRLRALGAGVVYVCQGLECPDVGADVYAMPLRRIAYRGAVVDCARDPLTCARAVAAAMLANAREQYHVLGPAKGRYST